MGSLGCPLVIVGMQAGTGFSAAGKRSKITLDASRCRDEMQANAAVLTKRHPDAGAVVLACTKLPPVVDALGQTTELPVFDAVIMVKYTHRVLTAGPD